VTPDGLAYSVHRSFVIPNGQTYDDWMRATVVCPFRTWILPEIGGTPGPQSTFVLWWMILLGLSSRARYQPQGWTRDLDVDGSRAAVVIERVLDACLELVPEMIAQAIDEASQSIGSRGRRR